MAAPTPKKAIVEVNASDDPRYLIERAKSGNEATHNPDSLSKAWRRYTEMAHDLQQTIDDQLSWSCVPFPSSDGGRHVARLPVRNRAVRAAEARKLHHPEGTTFRGLPI